MSNIFVIDKVDREQILQTANKLANATHVLAESTGDLDMPNNVFNIACVYAMECADMLAWRIGAYTKNIENSAKMLRKAGINPLKLDDALTRAKADGNDDNDYDEEDDDNDDND